LGKDDKSFDISYPTIWNGVDVLLRGFKLLPVRFRTRSLDPFGTRNAGCALGDGGDTPYSGAFLPDFQARGVVVFLPSYNQNKVYLA